MSVLWVLQFSFIGDRTADGESGGGVSVRKVENWVGAIFGESSGGVFDLEKLETPMGEFVVDKLVVVELEVIETGGVV